MTATYTALRAYDRTVGNLMSDPEITGDLLLVGLWLARVQHLRQPEPGEGGWSTATMSADLFPGRSPWRLRELLKTDIRRYDPFADLPGGKSKTTPCDAPTQRKPACGKSAYTWAMFTDPATGRKRMIGACRPHLAWWQQARDDNRAECAVTEVPRPPANTGGHLARHITAIDWPELWRRLDPEWECPPEVQAWERPKLRLLTGDPAPDLPGTEPATPRPRFALVSTLNPA